MTAISTILSVRRGNEGVPAAGENLQLGVTQLPRTPDQGNFGPESTTVREIPVEFDRFGKVQEEAVVNISENFLKKEDLRARLFGDTWGTLIPEAFQDVPAYYDKANAIASLGKFSRWSDTFVAAIHKHLPRGAKVLDVCSGTHDIPLRLLAMDPTLEIYTVDGSPHMTAEGQRRARERNLTIHAQLCDAHTLPFPDNSFDAVTIQFASRHLELIRVFKEIRRVLKPGGIFCHNDMLRPASRIIEQPYLVYLGISLFFTGKLLGSSPESMKYIGYFADAIHHFYTPRELTGLLEEVGFVGIENRSFLTGVLSYHISHKPSPGV